MMCSYSCASDVIWTGEWLSIIDLEFIYYGDWTAVTSH